MIIIQVSRPWTPSAQDTLPTAPKTEASKQDDRPAAPRSKAPAIQPSTDKSPPAVALKTEAPKDVLSSVANKDEGITVQEKDSAKDAKPKPPASKSETSSQAETNAQPKEPPQLKPPVKPPRTKTSAWSRLKKHLVVEPEIPQFPEPEPPQDSSKPKEEQQKEEKPQVVYSGSQELQKVKESRATKMWDAVLYQMLAAKDAIIQHINNKDDTEKKDSKKEEHLSFRYRLPLLLYKPRFDARKLKEAAAKPLMKVTTMFEMSLLNRKTPDEEPKDFNRTARGWQNK
uniref:Proline rich 33 n=1 Tax=Latimeria chalumnae TaxID=7897 RepID=H3API4_LATCH